MSNLVQVNIRNLLGAAACVGAMAFALYAQYVLDMEPCPLCIFQRVAVIGLGCVFLLAGLHAAGNVGRIVYAGMLALTAAIGMGVAARHVWLQNLPKDEVPACGPGLDFMLDTFPLLEVFSIVLSGSGECADVSWRLLGLTMPAWTLIVFIVLGAYGIWVNLSLRHSQHHPLEN
jgi:disulfide bond formation protein DsbB